MSVPAVRVEGLWKEYVIGAGAGTDGQIVGRLVYDRLTEIPDQIYGERIGSHYQAQGLKLSKHFKQE